MRVRASSRVRVTFGGTRSDPRCITSTCDAPMVAGPALADGDAADGDAGGAGSALVAVRAPGSSGARLQPRETFTSSVTAKTAARGCMECER